MTDPVVPQVKPKRGGARAGAGRRVKAIDVPVDVDPLDYLQALMTSKSSPEPLRLKAAVALAAYRHPKQAAKASLGKKEQKLRDAEEFMAEGGRFSPGRPPLAVVGRSTSGSD
jgi:hypothetical protein